MNDYDKLAVDGGTPVRQKPFPARIPFGSEEIRLVTEALESQNLFLGSKTAQFEKEFAELYNVKTAVACSSGTASVHMAIAALDPNRG